MQMQKKLGSCIEMMVFHVIPAKAGIQAAVAAFDFILLFRNERFSL